MKSALKYISEDLSISRYCGKCDGTGKLWTISSKTWPYGYREPIVVPDKITCYICGGTGTNNVNYLKLTRVN